MPWYLLWSLCKGWFLWRRSLGCGSIFCPPPFNLQLKVKILRLLWSCSWWRWESGGVSVSAGEGDKPLGRVRATLPCLGHQSSTRDLVRIPWGFLTQAQPGGLRAEGLAVRQLRRREQPAVCGTERSLGSCRRSWEPRARLGHRAPLPTAELCCLGLGVLTFSCGFILFQCLYCTSLYLPAPQAPRDSLGASQRNRAVAQVGKAGAGWQLQWDAAQLVLTVLCQPAAKAAPANVALNCQSFAVDLLVCSPRQMVSHPPQWWMDWWCSFFLSWHKSWLVFWQRQCG